MEYRECSGTNSTTPSGNKKTQTSHGNSAMRKNPSRRFSTKNDTVFKSSISSSTIPPNNLPLILDQSPTRDLPSPTDEINRAKTLPVQMNQPCPSNAMIQQAKKYAVAQAQQDGSTGNFRSFDSPFGNFLLPVIPTVADLNK